MLEHVDIKEQICYHICVYMHVSEKTSDIKKQKQDYFSIITWKLMFQQISLDVTIGLKKICMIDFFTVHFQNTVLAGLRYFSFC